ncbi:hypothetical protein DPMN_169239 [Dreissena polymorpha]|uniref:Uncharacterized protein n=2 Tax=Dreissena polymorpha TaxID=45954 RepID=A0A9D4J039_DREPO|nr:hypothetical protein DPMN_169239 [Dreissena polymorpha]
MHIKVSSSYQNGDHVLVRFLWDDTTDALDVQHEFPSNKTQIKIAKCDAKGEYSENKSECSLTGLSNGYVVWGANRITYLVIEEISDATTGMYFFIDRNNPSINLSIDVQPNSTTRCGKYDKEILTFLLNVTSWENYIVAAVITDLVHYFIGIPLLIIYVYVVLSAPARRGIVEWITHQTAWFLAAQGRIREWITQQTALHLRRNEVN